MGLEPGFVGWVPVRMSLDLLDVGDLKKIMAGAEGSYIEKNTTIAQVQTCLDVYFGVCVRQTNCC